MTQFKLDDSDVVVIVGSGAGGATLANELARRGVKSVILEAGKQYSLDDIENDEWASITKFGWLDKRIAAGGWPMTKTSPNAPVFTVKGVGGTTILWGAVAARFQPHDFHTRTTYGDVAGASLLDWPIGYDELAPYYERAEKKMGVAGAKASGLPLLPENNHYKVLAAGARKIGYSRIIRPLAINSESYDDRPGCEQIGFCQQGCKIGAKWSTLYTEVPAALATGKVELRTEVMALKVEHDKAGRVTGVLYADAEGKRHFQKAAIVCIAGNSIESPRLLLNSASAMFPHGLANSSGEVGKNYMVHTTGFSFAIQKGPVYMYRGTTLSAIIADEVAPRPARGFFGGYHLEGLAFGLPFAAAFMKPGGWGRDVTSAIDKYDNMTCIWICGEDLPQARNGVTLHATEKDQHGLAIPIVSKTDHANDVAMRAHAYAQSRKLAEAVGATRVIDTPPASAAHNMGTNRMSARPRDGVVDKWGRAHDVKNLFVSDGSQFTSSSAANPTLTIVALAIRQAEYIAGAMSRREI